MVGHGTQAERAGLEEIGRKITCVLNARLLQLKAAANYCDHHRYSRPTS